MPVSATSLLFNEQRLGKQATNTSEIQLLDVMEYKKFSNNFPIVL